MLTGDEKHCELCRRAGVPLTRHHLIPRCRHRKPRTRRLYTREEMKSRIAMLCRPCHATVHAHLTEQQLANEYSDVAALLEHPEITRFVAWVRHQPRHRRIPVRTPNARRSARASRG